MVAKLSRQLPSTEEHSEISEEILNGSDRSVAIILASEVERFLEAAILARFTYVEDEKKLICDDGPLATFSRKIQLGYAMGLYNSELRDDLNQIRNVRNDFAHSQLPICFNTPSVKDRCLTLKGDPETGDSLIFRWGLNRGLVDILVLYDGPDKAARYRFIAACNRVSEWLHRVITTPAEATAP
jgi:hypothetical protein